MKHNVKKQNEKQYAKQNETQYAKQNETQTE